MATLPTIPAFSEGDSSLTKLQELAGAVAFACQAPVIFHLYKTASQSVPANTATIIQWDAAMADSDGGWSSSHNTRYTAQTAGYFHVEALVPGGPPPGSSIVQTWLNVTTGPNNPGGAGNTIPFAPVYDAVQGTSTDWCYHTATTTPYLYVGDYLQVHVYWPATSVIYNWDSSGFTGLNGYPDGGPFFTGMWISEGP